MKIVKTDKQTYVCSNIKKLCKTLGVSQKESLNWEISDIDQFEIARDCGKNGFKPLILDTDGNKKNGTKITGLFVDVIGYQNTSFDYQNK